MLCDYCAGDGDVECPDCEGDGCDNCLGTGEIECDECDGTGEV